MDLSGTVALVMGASTGIGVAVVEKMAAAGAAVAIAARRGEALQELAARLSATGKRILPLPCDVADYEAVARTVEAAIRQFGRLDHLVNNAGVIEPIGALHETDPAAWARLIQINLIGAYHGCHAALPHLLRQGGTIVNVSSGAAHRPLEGWSADCASKAGLLMLSRSLMLEYGEKGLRTYGFAPGLVRTGMQATIRASGINPVSKVDPMTMLPPELPAGVIAWFCSREAADFPSGEYRIDDPELRARAGLPPAG